MITLRAGTRIGRFQIGRVLGRGSSGAVYLATDSQIERPIALKVFWPDDAPLESDRDEAEKLFLKEAQLAGRLQHPNIVTVYDIGREGDGFFIAMEYVEGEALKQTLRAGEPPPFAMAVSIVRQVAEALGHAHEKGVLHRDIKPGNILLSRDGRVKVTDFGVGEFLTATTCDRGSDRILGSPPYMSPEQIRDDRLDARADLFSLGVVFYELLTGTRPFGGDSVTKVAYQILNADPEDPRVRRPELPAAATEVFRRLLAKERDERPADAREFLREVARLSGEAAETVPVPPIFLPLPPPATSRGSNRWFALALAAAAALVAAALLVTGSRRGPSDAPGHAVTPQGRVALAKESNAVGRAGAGGVAAGSAGGVIRGPGEANVLPTAPSLLETSRRASPIRFSTPVSARPRSAASRLARTTLANLPDRVYRTRRFVRFGVRPDQSRLFVDGQYVGIADDWDGWAGGRVFPFSRTGTHRVRVELPGYRALLLVFLVTPEAKDDTVDVTDRLDRVAEAPYSRVSGLGERTTGAVEMTSDPPAATVSSGKQVLGLANAFGAQTPLRLPGPAVHELTFSAPERVSKTVRVLVSPNAGRDVARVRVRLDPTRSP